jgi:hypothetical protein
MRIDSLKKRWSMVSLLLLASCSFGLLGPQGLVLCLGQDGHVAVEAYCGVVYDQPQVGRNHSASEIRADENHCGSCSDSVLILDAIRTESSRDLVYPVLTSNPVIIPGMDHLAFDIFPTQARRVSIQDSTTAFPFFLRSTILLI